MKIYDLHSWDVSPAEAIQLQKELRQRLVIHNTMAIEQVHLVAGIDNGYQKQNGMTMSFAAAVVLQFPQLEVVETCYSTQRITFPYISGLLSFREAPAILAALRQLESEPDVFFFDGHGFAHPRRLGLACHLGLFLERPTVGVAKSRLSGSFDEPEHTFGAQSRLAGEQDETLGAVVRTQPLSKPIFVSPGHRVGFEQAVTLALACCRPNHRLPEPTRLADQFVFNYQQRYRTQFE